MEYASREKSSLVVDGIMAAVNNMLIDMRLLWPVRIMRLVVHVKSKVSRKQKRRVCMSVAKDERAREVVKSFYSVQDLAAKVMELAGVSRAMHASRRKWRDCSRLIFKPQNTN